MAAGVEGMGTSNKFSKSTFPRQAYIDFASAHAINSRATLFLSSLAFKIILELAESYIKTEETIKSPIENLCAGKLHLARHESQTATNLLLHPRQISG